MKYKDWIREFMSTYTLNIKPTSAKTYWSKIRTYIIPELGEYDINDITTPQIQQIYTKLYHEDGKSSKTIRDLHGIIHRSLKVAQTLGIIRINPADNIVVPRVQQTAIHPLSKDEVQNFISAISFHRFELFYLIALFTGARESEILGITTDCIDLSNSNLTLEKQLSYFGNGVWKFNTLKNNKVRTVCLPCFLRDKIAQHIQFQKQERIYSRQHLLFVNKDGEHISLKSVLADYKKLVAKIGRPTARFHDLRHTYATIALENGDNIKTVQYNLGHATASFTLSRYVHITDRERTDSALRMEQYHAGLVL